MPLLTAGALHKVRDKLASGKSEDTLVDPLLYTEFYDKVTIIARDWPFPENGLQSKRSFQRQMQAIQDLRDNLARAHPRGGAIKFLYVLP